MLIRRSIFLPAAALSVGSYAVWFEAEINELLASQHENRGSVYYKDFFGLSLSKRIATCRICGRVLMSLMNVVIE